MFRCANVPRLMCPIQRPRRRKFSGGALNTRPGREIFDHLTSRWGMLVLLALDEGPYASSSCGTASAA
jgi:DNA-binding HxlR family transcriptional regulator